MNFKVYDILSSLVPGFILLYLFLELTNKPFTNELIVPFTAIAFLIGFIVNTLSSWLEEFYFFTWRGKPSDRLLNGKDIWKVKFYQSTEIKEILKKETQSNNASNDELYSIAKMYIKGNDQLINDLNSSYAFSRSMLTVVLIVGIILIIYNYNDLRYYLGVIAIVLIVWLRCKQRAYYYAREVLSNYLHIKKSNP